MTSHEIQTEAVTPHEQAIHELENFTWNPALHTLAGEAGFRADPTGDGLVQLQEFLSGTWEVRNGHERQALDWSDSDAEQHETDRVFELTSQLGMVESSHPKLEEYDFGVILGGANKAPYDRLRYALEQGVDFKALVLLGGARKVGDKERAKTDTYAPGAETESDLMDGAVKSLLGDQIVDMKDLRIKYPGQAAGDDPKYWEVRYYELKDGTPIFSLYPDFARDPNWVDKNRPHSGDTYEFMRELAGDMLNEDTTALVVTNAFYTPAQHLDAVRELTLPTGARVETIGYDAEYGGTVRTAKQLKQELKSGVDAAVRLQTALNQE